MININIKNGISGKVSLQVLKEDPLTGELVPVQGKNKSNETNNIVTTYGINQVSKNLTPILPNHYIALGEGKHDPITGAIVKLDNFKLMSSSITPTSTTKNPTNYFTHPRIRNHKLQFQFSPQGASRNYTEIGIADTSNANTYSLYTYTTLKDEFNEDTTVTVAEDEYLRVTYTYQTQVMIHYPTNVDITTSGDTDLTGLKACLYRKTGSISSSTSKNLLYYSSEAAFDGSGWAERFDKFHKNSGELFGSSIGGGSSLSNDFFSISDGGGTSNAYAELTTKPTIKTITKTGSLNNITYAPGELTDTEEPIYIVGLGSAVNDYYITFNMPIPVSKYNKLQISVNINSSTDNETWIDVTQPPYN